MDKAITPGKAIRLRCHDCNTERDLSLCIGCQLKEKTLSNLKKIKTYCKVFCLNGNRPDYCSSPECSLYQYRLGHDPARLGIGNKQINTYKNMPKTVS